MIIIIYSLCPIFTKPPDWRKALSKGVKTHLFKLKTSKISQGGALPPPLHLPQFWGKQMIPQRGGGMIEKNNIYPWEDCLQKKCQKIKVLNKKGKKL